MGFDDNLDFDDLSFDDEPPFSEEDFGMPEFEPEEGGGISRTFKIVFAVLMVAVIGIVALLLWFALGTDEISPNQRTATAVVETNVALEAEYNNTQTAVAMAIQASQTAVRDFEVASTMTQEAANEQATQVASATNAAATEQAFANQTATAAAEATASQEALEATQTATAIPRLRGTLRDTNDQFLGNVTIRLYRDDGDGVFNPADLDVVEVVPGAAAAGEPQSTSYGETVDGTVEANIAELWTFSGSAGDVVTITTVAGDPVQMDLFLRLLGPNSALLTEDDDGGNGTNAAIRDFELPATGEYTIEVTTISGPGQYVMTLESANAAPEPAEQSSDDATTDEVTEEAVDTNDIVVPTQEGGLEGSQGSLDRVQRQNGIVLVGYAPQRGDLVAQGGATPTPVVTIDELLDSIVTGPGGEFDFGALEPGVYWLEADYDSLPPELRARIPRTERVIIRVDVPYVGDVTFTIDGQGAVVTETPIASATPVASVTGTVTVTVVTTSTPTVAALPTTGLFSDIANSASDVDGSNSLAILAVAAVGLVAIVIVARRLRVSR